MEFRRSRLGTGPVGVLLYVPGELDLLLTGQFDPVLRFEHVRDAALARLTVDPDHRVVGAADIRRVDREVRNGPRVLGRRDTRRDGLPSMLGETLLDRILMSPGEGGVDELAEQAAEELLRRIGAGEWMPGDKLPGETTLATQLGVGRSTIREAVRELAGQRILESRQGAGVFVIATQAAEDWDLVLHRADIADVLEGRLAIETEAARLAANRRTPGDLRLLRQTLAGRDRAAREADDSEYVEADLAFHRAVVTAAHNPVLVELFESFVPRVRRAMLDMLRIDRPQGKHRAIADQLAHESIVDAIRDRGPELATIRSRSHLSGIRDTVR